MKKSILIGLLLAGAACAAFAQQTEDAETFFPGLNIGVHTSPLIYTSPLLLKLNVMADGVNTANDPNYYPTGYDKFSSGGKVVLGFANLFFGLGSYIAGEWRDGLNLTLTQALSLAMIPGGLSLFGIVDNYFKYESRLEVLFFTWWIPFAVRAIGVLVAFMGGYNYIRTLLDGFLYPFHLGSPPSGNRSMKAPFKRMNAALVPLPNGKAAGQLNYTIRF